MPFYLPYLLLIEACFILSAFIFIVCNNSWIFYISCFKRKLKHSALTPNLTIHIICWWFVGITGIVCNLYVIIMWKPSPHYNSLHYFWTNLLAYGSNYTVPWSNIFLSVDRSLILLFPLTKNGKIRRNFCIFSVFIIFLSLFGVVLALLISQMNRDVSELDCLTLACVVDPIVYGNIVLYNYVISCLHFLIAIACLLILKHFNSTTNRCKVGENLVKYTIIVELCLDLIPLAISLLLINIFSINLNDYLGPYLRVLFALDGILTNRKYFTSLIRTFPSYRASNVVTVSQAITTNASGRQRHSMPIPKSA